MDFIETAYLPVATDSLAFGAPDENSILEATERLEPFLKGQGYLPLGGKLNLLNASVDDASCVLDLLYRLTSQQQLDDRAREQLRDQADKDRVALAHAQKRNESLEEVNRRLAATVKELEGKLLALRHKAEETERDLKQKLQSTTVRLNGYLYGGRDAGKRGPATGSGAAGTGAARRSAPTYDRFRDDPSEAAASVQKLEADLSHLRQQNARLQKELAAARKQLSTAQDGGLNASRAAGSPHRDGRRADQMEGPCTSLDLQPLRSALSSEVRNGLDGASGRGSASPDSETGRLQRLVRDLQLNVEQLQRTKQELQRQLDKSSAERSELHKTLHSLRSKCANLEVERRNAEDRFQRAQRATAALLDPAEAEAQTAELRAKLAAAEREIHEANARADGFKQQLAAAELDVEANQRHVEVLKRAVRVMHKGQEGLAQLESLVEEELQPLHAKLRQVTEELVTARAALEHAKAERAAERARTNDSTKNLVTAPLVNTDGASPDTAPEPATRESSPTSTSTADAEGVAMATLRPDGQPLSPAALLPGSPSAGFNGFAPKNLALADSPPLVLQPPTMHAFYNRAFASTMPSPHSECMVHSSTVAPAAAMSAATATEGGAQQLHHHQYTHPLQHIESLGPYGTASPRTSGTQPGDLSSGASAAGVSSPYMRRSVSAGVSHRMGEQYASAERQRARWQVHNPQARHRFPTPIDIILEQARNPTAVDATISIQAPIAEGSVGGASSRGSTP